MPDPIHLALGDLAANALGACFSRNLQGAGKILRFRDIYCVGPLAELGTKKGTASRAHYWRTLLPERGASVAEFEEEEQRYEAARLAGRALVPLVIWSGPHGSARLWLQRLCAELDAASDVRLIDVARAPHARQGSYLRRAVSEFTPEEVATLLGSARQLMPGERAALAARWRRDKAVRSGLRRLAQGRILHHPEDWYDSLLLAECGDKWRPAAEVIGGALGACDEFIGDVFFAWRLRALAQAGKLRHDGRLGYPPDYAVRLA